MTTKTTIADIQKKYAEKLDHLDAELLIAHAIKKSREFVLAHPEYVFLGKQALRVQELTERRLQNEPLAYILGYKEFFGYPFLVSNVTLIPRPETELMVEKALEIIKSYEHKNITIIDVGTGSGNIIISIAKNISGPHLFAVDISKDALRVARKNAKKNNVMEKIKFIHGDMLNPITKNLKLKIENSEILILANLPYLSKKIYSETGTNVKKFEPRSALLSPKEGLAHYEKLFKQIKKLTADEYPPHRRTSRLKAVLEFSPEQKNSLAKIIKQHFPISKTIFKKDLAGKWRLAIITI